MRTDRRMRFVILTLALAFILLAALSFVAPNFWGFNL